MQRRPRTAGCRVASMSHTSSGAVRWMITMDVASPTKGTVTDSACLRVNKRALRVCKRYSCRRVCYKKRFDAVVTLFPVNPIFIWIDLDKESAHFEDVYYVSI